MGKPIGSLLCVANNGHLAASGTNDGHQNEQPAMEPVTDVQVGDMDAAEAAGRARAETSRRERETLLERTIAASGFGRIQFVEAIAQPHQMLGRNVTIVKGNADEYAAKDEGSNTTSLSSSDEGKPRLISCRTSISPIVSAHDANEQRNGEHDACVEHKAKRHKHQDLTDKDLHASGVSSRDPSQHRRHQSRQPVTHYVIQLAPSEANGRTAQNGSLDSISSNSTSVAARLTGVSKATLRQQRSAVDVPQMAVQAELQPANGAATDSSDVDPVSAIG